jgi:hypothetical protein
MRGLTAAGVIVALVIAGSAAVLGVPRRTEAESSRMREIEALLDSTQKASALCTSAPAKPTSTPLYR